MNGAIFDPITNSEDEMLLRAGIRDRVYAPMYLRAYIMASLCIEPQFVVSDSAANLNKAFRTLVDIREGEGYNLNYLPKSDFEWLISEGHIRFAARDKYKGNFSEGLREAQKKMKRVDQPSERYTKRLDEICSNDRVYWFDLEEISKKFTENFQKGIEEALIDPGITLRREWLIEQLMDRLADQETYDYKGIKSILLEYVYEREEDYQAIRKIMRQAYEYNVPEYLGLDYYMPSSDAKILSKQNGRLELSREEGIKVDFACNVYGFAALPAKRLENIWASSEYEAFQKQLDAFRNNAIDLEKYLETLSRYLQVINEWVEDEFTQRYYKNVPYEKGKVSSIPIKVYQYFSGEESRIVAAKIANDLWSTGNLVKDILTGGLAFRLIDGFFSKILPAYAKKTSDFPELPEEVKEAIILQRRDSPQIEDVPKNSQ